mmetsp:Transcript_16526/g.23191  ORF Transcript_16526/g.23191 Transcript_16526/m.23191 type:complete len:653 (-) Transcript_16526:46-2004(-)
MTDSSTCDLTGATPMPQFANFVGPMVSTLERLCELNCESVVDDDPQYVVPHLNSVPARPDSVPHANRNLAQDTSSPAATSPLQTPTKLPAGWVVSDTEDPAKVQHLENDEGDDNIKLAKQGFPHSQISPSLYPRSPSQNHSSAANYSGDTCHSAFTSLSISSGTRSGRSASPSDATASSPFRSTTHTSTASSPQSLLTAKCLTDSTNSTSSLTTTPHSRLCHCHQPDCQELLPCEVCSKRDRHFSNLSNESGQSESGLETKPDSPVSSQTHHIELCLGQRQGGSEAPSRLEEGRQSSPLSCTSFPPTASSEAPSRPVGCQSPPLSYTSTPPPAFSSPTEPQDHTHQESQNCPELKQEQGNKPQRAFSTFTPRNSGSRSPFHASVKPSISIGDYLKRIHTYADCSDTCFVLCLIFIDRLIQSNAVSVNIMTIHRLLVVGVAVAAKFFDDLHYTNSHYSRVGGVPVAELNELELQFLFALNFDLHVDAHTFGLYAQQLQQIATQSDNTTPYHQRQLHFNPNEESPPSPTSSSKQAATEAQRTNAHFPVNQRNTEAQRSQPAPRNRFCRNSSGRHATNEDPFRHFHGGGKKYAQKQKRPLKRGQSNSKAVGREQRSRKGQNHAFDRLTNHFNTSGRFDSTNTSRAVNFRSHHSEK